MPFIKHLCSQREKKTMKVHGSLIMPPFVWSLHNYIKEFGNITDFTLYMYGDLNSQEFQERNRVIYQDKKILTCTEPSPDI